MLRKRLSKLGVFCTEEVCLNFGEKSFQGKSTYLHHVRTLRACLYIWEKAIQSKLGEFKLGTCKATLERANLEHVNRRSLLGCLSIVCPRQA